MYEYVRMDMYGCVYVHLCMGMSVRSFILPMTDTFLPYKEEEKEKISQSITEG